MSTIITETFGKESNIGNMTTEDRWASLTLSSLVKSSTSYLRILESDDNDVAVVFNQQVEKAHNWLLEGLEPPVMELFRLVKVSDCLKSYVLQGDESFINSARILLQQ